MLLISRYMQYSIAIEKKMIAPVCFFMTLIVYSPVSFYGFQRLVLPH